MSKGKSKSAAKGGKKQVQPQPSPWNSRPLQIAITCVIVIVFWNLLDFILDEYVTHEGYAFDVYYDVALPIIVGLAVELFPKKKK